MYILSYILFVQMTVQRPDDDEEDDHGGLVKKILETKKELETGSQAKKTEIVSSSWHLANK